MSSPFASDITETIENPFDPPHSVTVRKLSAKKLAKASQANTIELISTVQAMGGAKAQREMRDLFKPDPSEKAAADETAKAAEAVEKMKADPLNGYDKHALLYAGITAWSYGKPLTPEPVEEVNVEGQTVTVMRIRAIDDCDPEFVDFYADKIMRLTKPSAYLSKEEAKAEQVKDSGASIGR